MRDAYRSLVSEFMLQQTQVSRVIEKFAPFIERFPNIEALANADEKRARLMESATTHFLKEYMRSPCCTEWLQISGGAPVNPPLSQGICAVTRAGQCGPSNRKHEKEQCG